MRSTKTTTPNTSPVPEPAKSNKVPPVPEPAKSNKAPPVPALAKYYKASPAPAKSNMSPAPTKSNKGPPAPAKSNTSPALAKSNKVSPAPAKSNKAPASETPVSPEENPGETSKNDVKVVKGRKRKSVRFSDPSGKIEENSGEQNVVAGRHRVQKSANVKQLESDAGETVPKQTPVKVENRIVSGKRKRTSTDTAVTPVPNVSADPENFVPGKRRRQSSSPEVVDSHDSDTNEISLIRKSPCCGNILKVYTKGIPSDVVYVLTKHSSTKSRSINMSNRCTLQKKQSSTIIAPNVTL